MVSLATMGGLLYSPALLAARTYCMFIGYPRSGHSLIGAILDAHPRAIIAHEADALSQLEKVEGRNDLYRLLADNASEYARGGREWNGYSYVVVGQSQGHYGSLPWNRPIVVGDKKGGGSTRRLRDNPELLDRLRAIVGADIRLVHVVRHPLDNIATMFKSSRRTLQQTIDFYFSLCETNAILDANHRVFDIHHEDFCAAPERRLSELCAFLGLPVRRSYLSAAASIVNAPHESRHSIDFEGYVPQIKSRAARYDFLRGYSF